MRRSSEQLVTISMGIVRRFSVDFKSFTKVNPSIRGMTQSLSIRSTWKFCDRNS